MTAVGQTVANCVLPERGPQLAKRLPTACRRKVNHSLIQDETTKGLQSTQGAAEHPRGCGAPKGLQSTQGAAETSVELDGSLEPELDGSLEPALDGSLEPELQGSLEPKLDGSLEP